MPFRGLVLSLQASSSRKFLACVLFRSTHLRDRRAVSNSTAQPRTVTSVSRLLARHAVDLTFDNHYSVPGSQHTAGLWLDRDHVNGEPPPFLSQIPGLGILAQDARA